MGIHGNGRPATIDKYNSIAVYLDKHLFPIKDSLFEMRKTERKKLKEYEAARNTTTLQGQRLERAYEGLEKFRK